MCIRDRNVVGVTSYLRERIIENGGDPERETLNVIPTPDGAMFYKDSKGCLLYTSMCEKSNKRRD